MRIAVVRALQLGDLLCIVPALRALDAADPEAEITLIGLPWARGFAGRMRRYVDAFEEFPGFLGIPERDLRDLPAFFEAMRARRFDLAIQMHGSGRFTNPFTVLLGAQHHAGFFEEGAYCPDPGRFLRWRPEEHEVLRWLRLLSHLGVPAQGHHLEFPLAEADWKEFRGFGLRERRYAVVHPGSQLPSRRWPAERFAEVADELAMDGFQVVVTGTEQERPVVEKLKHNMREPILDLCGRTSLGGLAAVVSRARLVVSNDTGISHIASAMRTPSVVVACGSDPRRWAPLNRALHRVLAADVECRPCVHAECPIGHPCALGIHARDVLSEAHRLLECAA